MDLLRLAEGPDVRALTYASLGLLLGPGSHTISILTGFPVELMADRTRAQATLKELRSWLIGDHDFCLDGAEIELQIEAIKAIPQPMGSFFNWIIREDGTWARTRSEMDALVAVCDIGFNTLDLIGLQGGQVISEFTGGQSLGVRRAAEILIQKTQAYDVDLTRHEADVFLRMRMPIRSCSAGDIDIRDEVAQALEMTATEIAGFLKGRWEKAGRIRHLIFSGGGTLLFKPYLLRAYPRAKVLADPVMANATGFARYGRRIYGDDSQAVGLDPGFGGFKVVSA